MKYDFDKAMANLRAQKTVTWRYETRTEEWDDMPLETTADLRVSFGGDGLTGYGTDGPSALENLVEMANDCEKGGCTLCLNIKRALAGDLNETP
jgi:predicted NAD/FAD-dependent oxidoreductase